MTERKALQFLNGGLQISRPVDRLDPAKYLRLVNVRSYIQGLIQQRPGQQRLTDVIADTPIHSIRRLNVNVPNANQSKALICGCGTKLYTSDESFSVLTQKDTGYSGDYLSLIPHRPTQSAESWMYVGDRNKMRKVRVNGTNYQMGIAPPNVAPTAQIAQPIRTTISDFEAVGAWTNGGDAAAPVAATRLTGATVITRVLYDNAPTNTGLASVQPSVLDDNVQAGMFLIVDAGGTPETFVVEKVLRSIVNTTIGKIIYDAGNVGSCTIQLAAPVAYLERDTLLLINSGGGTEEAVRVQSATLGPDGLLSIKVTTVNNHVAAETVNGLGSFRAYLTATHVAAQTLTTNKFRSALTFSTGIGYLNLVQAFSLATSSSRPIQDDDEIHISLRIDNLSRLLEARVLFDVDANTNDFTRNYYYYAISPNALTQALQNTVTDATAQARILQQRQLNDYYSERRTFGTNKLFDPEQLIGDTVYRVPRFGGYYADPIAPPDLGEVVPQTVSGDNQWTELVFKVGDLTRVGADESRTLKNVAAVRIQFQVTADIVADVDAWWIGGTYGPDSSLGSPYFYAFTGRNSLTGATSNPSPPMRSGVEPHRQRVIGTLTQHADTQVDLLDIYRYGGSRNVWLYVTTVPNAATPTFQDDFPDDSLAEQRMEEDNYQPFPSTDIPRSGFSNASGTKLRWRSGDIFNASWGRNALIRVNGVPYTLYSQPTVTALIVTNATNTSPIVITTSANHGLNTGDGVHVASVLGNTAANGDWVVTAISATTFSLDTSVGNSAYVSGGTATKCDLETNENMGDLSNVTFELPDAILLGQPLPVMWGPYGGGLGGVFMFACGDSRLPGVLFVTKGNNPDSSFYRLEITSGSEVLMNGCIYDGRGYVFSTERTYSIEPINGGQDWVAREVANSIGLYCRWGLTVGDKIYFVGKDGIYESEGGIPHSITDDNFYNLFMHDAGISTVTDLYGIPSPDWADPDNLRLDYHKNWLYLDYKVGGFYFTLVYDILNKRWTKDTYADSSVATHYGNEGEAAANILMGGANGRLYNLTADFLTDAGAVFTSQVTTSFEDMGDGRSEKMFQDIYLDMEAQLAPIAPTVKAYLSNNYGTPVDTFTPTVAVSRNTTVLDLNSGSGRLGRSIGLDIQWSNGYLRLYEYHYSFYPKTDRSIFRATDWTDAGTLRDKFFHGLIIRANTFNAAKSFSIEYDGGSSAGPFSITHNGEEGTAISFPVPFIAKLLRLISADTDPWLLLDVEWDFSPEPELVTEYEAQPSTFGIDGFKTLSPTAYIAHRSTVDLTLTITVDGTNYNYTVPHSSGNMRETRVVLDALKGKIIRPKITSAAGFRLYKAGCVLGIKMFGSPSAFQTFQPFGAMAPDMEARV